MRALLSLFVVCALSSVAWGADELVIASTRPGTTTVSTPFDLMVVLPGGWTPTMITVNDVEVPPPVKAPTADFVLLSIPKALQQAVAADYKILVIAKTADLKTKTATAMVKLDAQGLPVVAPKPTLQTGGLFGAAAKTSADVLKGAGTEIGANSAAAATKISDMLNSTALGWTVKGVARRGVARRDIDPIETTTRLETIFSEFAWRAYQEHHAGKTDVAKLEADLHQAIRDRVWTAAPFVQEEWKPYLEAVEASMRRLADSDKLDLTNGLHVSLVLAALGDGFGKLKSFHEQFDKFYVGSVVGTGGAMGGVHTGFGGSGAYGSSGRCGCDDCCRRRHRATCLRLVLLGL